MAEELKQTKIPRFESGSSTSTSSVLTRIPKPSGFARPTAPAREGTLQSNPLPRKSFLCRFGVANKIQINGLLSKNPLKSSTQTAVSKNFSAKPDDARAANETIELTKGTAMNITKPVIGATNTADTSMDRSLTRSNTFVYETVDDTQAKLLSVTHNINAPQTNDTMSQTHKQQPQQQQQQNHLNKERTFKRSLSPIPGESMNSAKRKPVHVSANRKVTPGPILNSTPRRSMSHSDSRNQPNLTFFGARSNDLSGVEHLQMFQIDGHNRFEQSNNFAPDATVQLSRMANATMHGNRVFDLTQTVEQQHQLNDTFYPENRTLTTAHDANAAEHELANDGDALNPNDGGGGGDLGKTITVEKTQPIQIAGSGLMNADLLVAKKRFSLGLELPECTLDCSIELCDSSAATSAQDSSPLLNYKSQSYDMDESLGILTPDQMIEFLDTNASNAKIDLPNSLPVKMESHQKCHRLVDQTPSPEELPLDPIEVKAASAAAADATFAANSSKCEDADVTLQPLSICDQDSISIRLHSDTDSKADQMVKSTTSKTTNSFITSVTSIASLDNGYHADGEMSRPASRGAESPLRRVHNARQNKFHANGSSNGVAVLRHRQDPMTDSDFFTESDADDIFQRRHVAIIDGHMYNGVEDIFIDEAPPENDMESSGVYTDVEQHRSDNHNDNVSNSRNENENESGDMSPDNSSDTIKSSEYANDSKTSMPKTDLDNTTKTATAAQQQQQSWAALPTHSNQSIAAMSSSSSATINDSVATCLCEKSYGMKNKGNNSSSSSSNNSSGGGSSKRASGGDLAAQLVINCSDASPSSRAKAAAAVAVNNEKKSSCKLHSIGRSTDSDNSKSASKAATSQFNSNGGTPKVKRSSQNRKQCKSETGSNHHNSNNTNNTNSKRNETPKRESKSIGVRNRSSALGVSKKLAGTKSPQPIENGRHSENTAINMTSDQTTTVVTVHLRKTVPNKWDAVMNKIALNKAEVKTVKYCDVKSKVTSGIKRNSPSSKTLNGSNSNCEQQQSISDSGNSSLTSTKSSASPIVTRQSTHGISKRSIERDSSKDSHFSLGHDSTITPPGKLSKSTTPSSRSSARKRSSIQNGFSPNDSVKLTAETTPKSDSPTTKPAVLHKRFTPNNATTTPTATSVSSSPISEKRSTITVTKKSSNKQHVNQTIIVPPVANSTLHAKEHGLHSTLSHPPIINNNNSTINNNNHRTKSGSNPAKLTSVAIASATVAATAPTVAAAATVNDDHHQQPIIASIHRNGRVSEAASAAKKAVAIPKVKSKSKSKTKSIDKTLTNGDLIENLIEFSIVDSIDGNQSSGEQNTLLSLASPQSDKIIRNQQHQQLKTPTPADLNVIQANKTIVAMSILIQHLTTDLKAFETPSLRAALGTAKDKLLKSQQNLDTMRTKCISLEEQMIAKEQFFTTNELVLKQTQCELEKIQSALMETQKSAKQQIQTLQYELAEINQQHADSLKACQMKADRRCNELETQLQISRDREHELVDRLNECSVTENRLRDKVQASEQDFAQRLIAATARERELNEKVAQLMHQLKISEDKRYELEEKLKLAHDESVVLRKRRNSNDNCLLNGSNTLVQNLTGSGGSCVGNSSMMLEEEVLSLRSVLEMKLNEISELRKQNQAMQSAQDELPKAQLKISILESRLEDLTLQLKTKVEEEQELSIRNRSLQEMFNQESKNRTRLALHNEELQWKLKQNSEKYTSTLSELSKSYQDPSLLSDFKNSLYAPISETSLDHNQDTPQQNSSSPLSSPVVKGVVEKCDSVSYVLELNDEESAEAVASRVVKRAGSFRVNNFKERSPSFKRQLSLGGVNALSQSASATSLLRQHSDSPVRCGGAAAKIQRNSRTRSNSLNASIEPKKVNCSPLVPDMAPADYIKWQRSMKSMTTSSPLTSRSLQKSKKNGQSNGGLLEIDDDIVVIDEIRSADDVDIEIDGKDFPANGDEQQRSGQSDLCRTILTPQNSVNTLKKRQQKLKASAGEAMVSQQSEDDQSFGSDMDSATTSSSSSSCSAAASPSHSEPQHTSKHHRHLSLDEEAFMNKIVASLSTRSTPMEVSWSEDGDNEPYAQESSA